jgi:hypothetical protein
MFHRAGDHDEYKQPILLGNTTGFAIHAPGRSINRAAETEAQKTDWLLNVLSIRVTMEKDWMSSYCYNCCRWVVVVGMQLKGTEL